MTSGDIPGSAGSISISPDPSFPSCACAYTCKGLGIRISLIRSLPCLEASFHYPFFQATVGDIVPGGAADVDGRLQMGDEITHVNGHSVMDAFHRDVISAMGEGAAQGEVVLRIQRSIPGERSGVLWGTKNGSGDTSAREYFKEGTCTLQN